MAEGWRPPVGWRPDPDWPPPPSDWRFWVEDTAETRPVAVPAPDSCANKVPRSLVSRIRRPPKPLVSWAGLAVLAVLGVGVGGIGCGLGALALGLAGVAAAALLRGEAAWAGVRNRTGGAVVLAVSLAIALGVKLAPSSEAGTPSVAESPPAETTTAAPTSVQPTSTTASSSAAAKADSPTATATTTRPQATTTPATSTPSTTSSTRRARRSGTSDDSLGTTWPQDGDEFLPGWVGAGVGPYGDDQSDCHDQGDLQCAGLSGTPG